MLSAPDPAPAPRPRRPLIAWAAAAVVLLLALVAAVVALNATLFGAAGFVRVYLDALARGDAEGALSIPGVDPGEADARLLARDALGELEVTEVRELGERAGVHEVEAGWRTATGAGTTLFRVERIGTTAGLFPRWGFAESPLATLELGLANEDRVRVNGLETTLPEVRPAPHELAVFVPGGYALRHESRWLTSEVVRATAAEPGARVPATVEVVADEALLAELDEAARRVLDECATQTVLFPPGCPFGHVVSNRVVSEPEWSIAEYPELAVSAREASEPDAEEEDADDGAEEEPRWRAGPAPGVARLVVEVQSLFDGSVETLEEEVDFELAFELRLGVGDRLTIVPVDTLAR